MLQLIQPINNQRKNLENMLFYVIFECKNHMREVYILYLYILYN